MRQFNKRILIIAIIFLIIFLPFVRYAFFYQTNEVSFIAIQKQYRDKGYSEFTYNGFEDYSYTQGEGFDTYISSQDVDLESNGSMFDPLIRTAFESGSEVVGGGGFNIAFSVERIFGWTGGDPSLYEGEPLTNSDGYSYYYSDKYFVLNDDEMLAKYYKNAIGIIYKANEAGFMAGVAAAMYSFAIQLTNDTAGYRGTVDSSGEMVFERNRDGDNLVGTWGGVQYSSVVGYMSGYEQGINFFNYAILGYNPLTLEEIYLTEDELTKYPSLMLAQKINENKDANASIDKIYLTATDGNQFYTPNYEAPAKNYKCDGDDDWTNANEDIWFNGLFNYGTMPGGVSADAKTTAFINHDTAAVFPVAGGQTVNALNKAKNSKNTAIIGVDSDLGLVYDSDTFSEHILGSATKNLEISTGYALIYARLLTEGYTEEEAIAEMANITLDAPNDRYIYGEEKIPNGKVFYDTWNYEPENKDSQPGTQFVGTYNNGGTNWASDSSAFKTPEISSGSETVNQDLLDTLNEVYPEGEEISLTDQAYIDFLFSIDLYGGFNENALNWETGEFTYNGKNYLIPYTFGATPDGQIGFLDFAFDYNDGNLDGKIEPDTVEAYSNTFSVPYLTYQTDDFPHIDINNELPWIPYWNEVY